MEYRMIALDLDGTLTDSGKGVTARTKRAVQEAAGMGVTVCLASGRPLIGIQRVAGCLELERTGGYIIAYNGGEIFDSGQRKAIFRKELPQEYYPEICRLSKQYHVQALTYDTSCVVAEDAGDVYVQKEAYNNSVGIRQVGSLAEYVSYPAVKFMSVGEPERLERLRQHMAKRYQGILEVYYSEPYFLEIMPAGIEKARALGWLLERLNYKREELMAFGDGYNDIPMLEYAGFSVAMGNAYQDVKDRADYVTDSNDEDGVAKALRRLLLKKGVRKDESFGSNGNI